VTLLSQLYNYLHETFFTETIPGHFAELNGTIAYEEPLLSDSLVNQVLMSLANSLQSFSRTFSQVSESKDNQCVSKFKTQTT